MRDWTRHVTEHLALPDVDASTERDTIEEIACQLADAYRAAREEGASPDEADSQALALIGDWERLARDILDSKRGRARAVARRVEKSESSWHRRGGF